MEESERESGLPREGAYGKCYNTPVLCKIDLQVGSISCGDEHSLFLTRKL